MIANIRLWLRTWTFFSQKPPTFERGDLTANEETPATGSGLIPVSHLAITLDLTTTAQNATMDIDSASPTDIKDDFLHVNYIAILEILSASTTLNILAGKKLPGSIKNTKKESFD
ncbi:hypothetical protein CDAR_201951 [Caerostris darwini]|uniref:Uncharacterized protein n=1 Tax=Caerostris darwini TaxID=1538125 RepID=A0AAV4UVP5_9ARAC|nr:hypothetical protein CDAR_201951 [Caerostris darwini]